MNTRPAPGICLHVDVVSIRDGDTLVVSLKGGGREWAIRLIDCWAPELSGPLGRVSFRAAQELIDSADPDEIMVHIPEPKHTDNLLRNLTFDRIPGTLWLDENRSLNAEMVRLGFATKTKEG